MTIWTVSAMDNEGRYGLDMNICGSYTTRGMALDKCVELIMEWLRDELGGQGCYFVHDGQNEYRFNVDENDVEGTIWQTVTWGASDTENPEFTTPWPETFTGEVTAVEAFIGYVKDLYRSRHMKWSDEFIRNVRKSLVEDGKVQVDLNDGCCVSCVLYHDDAKNIKE